MTLSVHKLYNDDMWMTHYPVYINTILYHSLSYEDFHKLMNNIEKWIEINCSSEYVEAFPGFFFTNKNDAMLFKLNFG